jgi:hypothetical protein
MGFPLKHSGRIAACQQAKAPHMCVQCRQAYAVFRLAPFDLPPQAWFGQGPRLCCLEDCVIFHKSTASTACSPSTALRCFTAFVQAGEPQLTLTYHAFSSTMLYPVPWRVQYHAFSSTMPCPVPCGVQYHAVSSTMPCPVPQVLLLCVQAS